MNRIIISIIVCLCVIFTNTSVFAYEDEIREYVAENGFECGNEYRCLYSKENLIDHYWFKQHWVKHSISFSGWFCTTEYERTPGGQFIVTTLCMNNFYSDEGIQFTIHRAIHESEYSMMAIPDCYIVQPTYTEKEIEKLFNRELEYWYKLINMNLRIEK